MPRSHTKMRLKSAPQKMNFVMAKAISKRQIVAANALAQSCMVTHSNAALKYLVYFLRAVEFWPIFDI